ncbi:envelope stress response membrane protein PspC [Aliidiomarina sanyensis]|uniref:Envelope stress response membrane protein PspC n=1 Tax=Aliidiomarina sanyensis TaxID=1249555 RepID=A0A432WRL0_9GAMM|nr:envelope stress response membrane protein PspC [Aliidiomarina sanyensis]RUO36405.1 envelope stress response membrane protein PspC [Aliidiomarina sanyensis]
MTKIKKNLMRDPVEGKIAGVCAGLAKHFGWELWVVRIVAITALILASKITLTAYIIAWIVLDKAPEGGSSNAEPTTLREETRIERTNDGRTIEVKTKVWEAGKPPAEALKDIQATFADMENSVRKMEEYVTSSEFRVRQEINRL